MNNPIGRIRVNLLFRRCKAHVDSSLCPDCDQADRLFPTRRVVWKRKGIR